MENQYKAHSILECTEGALPYILKFLKDNKSYHLDEYQKNVVNNNYLLVISYEANNEALKSGLEIVIKESFVENNHEDFQFPTELQKKYLTRLNINCEGLNRAAAHSFLKKRSLSYNLANMDNRIMIWVKNITSVVKEMKGSRN